MGSCECDLQVQGWYVYAHGGTLVYSLISRVFVVCTEFDLEESFLVPVGLFSVSIIL